MTDEIPEPDGATGGPIRLPDTTKAALRDWAETRNPEALEFFLSSIVEISEERAHSGPLPAPETLAEYEKILPGLAERIVRLAEQPHEEFTVEQRHRHGMEGKIFDHTRLYRTTGLWMGFFVALLSLASAFYCASKSNWLGVAAFLCLPVLGVISVLVTGKPWVQAPEKGDGGSKEKADDD